MNDIQDEPPPVLLPCSICSRTFRPEVLERHIKVCEKTSSKKRRVFDSFKSRVSGTELEEFLGPAPLPGQAPRRPCKSPVKKRGPSKWKETHENLIATLRAARGVEPPPDTMIEAPKPSGNERCPSCNRYFGPRAFDRHVEFCKEKTARIKLTPSKISQAQERLEARTKYRAPLSIKPKLTTKEKYSPMLTRKESVESCSVSTTSTKTSPPLPTLNRNLKASKQNTSNFSRQSPIRSSERQRSVSPLKKTVPSSSKANVKSEAQAKPTIKQPKIKENLTSPEDLRPKTGTKASTQEKNRASNSKLSLWRDEHCREFKKFRTKTREKFPSDNDSIGTIESETNTHHKVTIKQRQSKWSNSAADSKTKPKSKKKENFIDEAEKINLDLIGAQKFHMKTRDDLKSEKKKKQKNPQINDLRVNDEGFGILVAPCMARPISSSPSRTTLKMLKESEKKKDLIIKGQEGKLFSKTEKKKMTLEHTKRTPPQTDHTLENKAPEDSVERITSPDSVMMENIQSVTKSYPHILTKKSEQIKAVETETEILPSHTKLSEVLPEDLEEKIKKNSKKWRNITEIPTEDLMQLSEDFQDEVPALSESAIWEIAAEQFLKSDEPTQSTSAFSVDSLNENSYQNINKPELDCEKSSPIEDDFIVLHAADPTTLIENDTDMKLSISEPCFPYSRTIHKFKKTPESKQIDIIVFTAFPSAIQSKITRHKQIKRKKIEKLSPLELSHIREKTFLASDIPKAKRRKISSKSGCAIRSIDFGDQYFSGPSKKEIEDRQKKFIDCLKNQREKIQKWQITANSHVRFLEEFKKSIEDDLKELRNLSRGKKIKRRSYLKEFKKEKIKKLQEQAKRKMKKKASKGKTFEYFEISLVDEAKEFSGDENQQEEIIEANSSSGFEKKSSFLSKEENYSQAENKKFEYFEVANKILFTKLKKKKAVNSKIKPDENLAKCTVDKSIEEFSFSDFSQKVCHQNSSLDNIEEVDENVEDEKEASHPNEKNHIEIEDFILAKPNTQKILSKENNCLEELFPKPKRIAEVLVRSATTVHLDFTSDSMYDLKSNEDKKILPQISDRVIPTRILQRIKKESKLPKIWEKNSEQKENSFLSLIDVWKNKREGLDRGKSIKGKAAMPTGKLPPLLNKNSFQIGGDSNDSYDPFKQAERQMLALLSWPSTADIKTLKNFSPSPKSNSLQISNLETSPTSAFTKYPNKNDEPVKNEKSNARKNSNETFAVNANAKKSSLKEKPTYTAADDWEQIFEKHFDLNRNEMTEQMTRSVKSALDGLLKSTIKNKSSEEDYSPPKNKSELSQNSIITEVLYTSTPKQNSESDKSSKQRSKDSTIDFDETPNTYRKTSNFSCGRITPPEDFNDPLGKTKKYNKMNRNSGISLSSLSFCSQISDTTLADEEVMQSNLEILGKAAAVAAARTPRRKYARSQSVFDERNKMLFAKTYDPNCSSSDENDADVLSSIVEKQKKKSPSRSSNPKSSPSHFFRSQSAMDGRCKGDGDHSEEGDHVSSPESNRNRKAKLSGDSAYSSLNRRSPRQSTQRNQQEDRPSSSGSEHSLPAIDDYNLKPKSLDFDSSPPPKKDQPMKMSKFCHECGSKYPIAIAKFCCECGVRRLII